MEIHSSPVRVDSMANAHVLAFEKLAHCEKGERQFLPVAACSAESFHHREEFFPIKSDELRRNSVGLCR